jgi:hypothetical protein
MEMICEIFCSWVIGFLGLVFARILSWVVRGYEDLPAGILHLRLFGLSAAVTLFFVVIAHSLALLNWPGFPFFQLIYLIGFPLTLLGELLSEFLDHTTLFNVPSLNLWVRDILFLIQWVFWGQLLSIYIRAKRQEGPGYEVSIFAQNTIKAISRLVEKVEVNIREKHGETGVKITGLTIGLIIIVSGCLLVVSFCKLIS